MLTSFQPWTRNIHNIKRRVLVKLPNKQEGRSAPALPRLPQGPRLRSYVRIRSSWVASPDVHRDREKVSKDSSFAIGAANHRDCLALRAQNPERVSKTSPRACWPGVPKKNPIQSKESRESLSSTQKVHGAGNTPCQDESASRAI